MPDMSSKKTTKKENLQTGNLTNQYIILCLFNPNRIVELCDNFMAGRSNFIKCMLVALQCHSNSKASGSHCSQPQKEDGFCYD